MNCNKCGNILNKNDSFCTNCGESYSINKNGSGSVIKKQQRKNIFAFPCNHEYENKWWHRLAKVLIYGSTIGVFIFSITFFVAHVWEWGIPDPKYVYSFERNYSSTFGFSKKCTFSLPNNKISLMIDCGNISEKSYSGEYYFLPDFLDRYSKSKLYQEEFLSKEVSPDCDPKEGDRPTILCYHTLNVNYGSLNYAIEQGHFDNIKAKRVIVLFPFLKNVVILIIFPLIWFFVLKSVIYKTLLYVIIGNKKYEM